MTSPRLPAQRSVQLGARKANSYQLAYWQVSNYDFVTAAKDASEDTMCASPIWPFPRPDFEHSKVEDLATGNQIPFTPDDCLMIFGYGGLKLRDYNGQNSTWP